MEVKLAQHEIERAVRLYLTTEEGIKLEGRKLEIEFQSGRNPPSVTADIKISKAETLDDADATVMKEEEEAEPTTIKPFSDEQQNLPFLGD
jgi:hypothetical protein